MWPEPARIAAGASYTVSPAVTIPGGTAAGPYYVWATLDINNQANQSDYTNDKANTAFTVTGLLSDLVVQSLSVNPTSGPAGSSATVSLTIRNQGTGTALGSTTNIRLATSNSTVTGSDPLLVQLSIPSIAAGASYTVSPAVTIPGGRATGTNYIWVILDINNAANQSNYTNDKANTLFTIR